MDGEDLRVLRDVEIERFIELHNLAFVAVKGAAYGEHEERWARAAEPVCNFLTFIETRPNYGTDFIRRSMP